MLGGGVHGQPGRHGAQFGIVQPDGVLIGQSSLPEFKRMHHLIAGAAAKELSAILRELQPVEGFVDARARHDVRSAAPPQNARPDAPPR